MKKLSLQNKGEIAQLKIELEAAYRGITINKPTIPSRYDLIFDDGNSLKRVQIKYADSKSSRSDGAINVGFRKIHKNNILLYTKKEVDLILVYLPSIDKILKFEPNIFDNKKAICIRIKKAKNNNKKRINDYTKFLW